MYSVIIPVRNEKSNLRFLLDDLLEYSPDEIIVIDDGDDNTDNMIRNKYPDNDSIKYFEGYEKGLSAAVIQGIRESSHNKIVVMDGDGQHPASVVPKLAESLLVNDVSIGSRWIKGGGHEGFSLFRLFVSKVANLLALPLTPVTDRTSGLFAIRRSVIDDVYLNPIGFKILLEILVKGKYISFNEVPFIFGIRHKGDSKFTTRQIFKYLRHLSKLYFYVAKRSQFTKYALVGGIGAGIHFGVLGFLTEVWNIHYMVSSVIAASVALVANFTMNKLWTFRPDHNKEYQKVSADYDFHAFYRGNFIQRWWKQRIAKTVWKFLPDDGLRTLDIGCGSSPIITNYSNAIGVDNDVDKINFMREKFGESIKFDLDDVTNLSLPDKSFDNIICTEVLEHVDAEVAIKEIVRVLKPNGIAVIATPNSESKIWQLIEKVYGTLIPTGYHDDHTGLKSTQEIIELFKQNGMILLEKEMVGGADFVGKFIKRNEKI